MSRNKKYNTGLELDTLKMQTAIDESLLAAAVYFSQDSILITTADFTEDGPRIVYVNPAFTRMTGYTSAESIGKTPKILQGPKTDKSVLAQLQINLSKGEVFRGWTVNYRKDGSEFINEWHIEPIKDLSSNITHFLSIQRDITDRKKMEDELREQKNILEQKNAALREILDLVEIEKNKIKENVSSNVEDVVLPALNRLGRSGSRNEKKYIGIVEQHLKDLTSSFGAQGARTGHRLSPREVEIGNLVKLGKSSKDIGVDLGISIKTVETIRNKIRRKLGLVNRRVNLTSYFRNT